MAIALVGSAGAVTTGAAGAAVTPTFAQAPIANNLLVCQVASGGGSGQPGAIAGWSRNALGGTTAMACMYWKIAAGGDAAPTVPAVAGAVCSARLLEFSGVATAASNDRSATAAGTTSPVLSTNPAADVAAGELILYVAAATYSAAGTNTLTPTLNNGAVAASDVNTNSTSTANCYDMGFGITTSKAAADSCSMAVTTTLLSACSVVIQSLKLPVMPVPQPRKPTKAPALRGRVRQPVPAADELARGKARRAGSLPMAGQPTARRNPPAAAAHPPPAKTGGGRGFLAQIRRTPTSMPAAGSTLPPSIRISPRRPFAAVTRGHQAMPVPPQVPVPRLVPAIARPAARRLAALIRGRQTLFVPTPTAPVTPTVVPSGIRSRRALAGLAAVRRRNVPQPASQPAQPRPSSRRVLTAGKRRNTPPPVPAQVPIPQAVWPTRAPRRSIGLVARARQILGALAGVPPPSNVIDARCAAGDTPTAPCTLTDAALSATTVADLPTTPVVLSDAPLN